MLLTIKQTNEMLLKNHDLRPTSTSIVSEKYVDSSMSSGQFRGSEKRRGCGF